MKFTGTVPFDELSNCPPSPDRAQTPARVNSRVRGGYSGTRVSPRMLRVETIFYDFVLLENIV